jgi:hypothetical protein
MSAVEVQPSPEGFIAQAGSVINETGLKADLAPTSPGGLTTGLIPPGVPTMIAAGMRAIGENQLAVRWFSIVSIAVGLLLIYTIGSRFMSHQGSLQALAIAGLSAPWVLYGRQASLAVAGIPLVLGGLWMLLKMSQSTRMPSRISVAAGYVLLCAVSGWVSIEACFTLVLLSAGFALLTRNGLVVLACGTGLLATMPWLAMMFSTYGDQVLLASSISVPFSEVTPIATGPLDAVILLVVSSPALILSIFWCASLVLRKTLMPQEHEIEVRSIGLWFVVSIVVVALQAQRGFFSFVLVIPAASLLSVYALEQFRRRATPVLFLTALAAVGVSSSLVLMLHVLDTAAGFKLLYLALLCVYVLAMAVQVLRAGRWKSPGQMAAGLYPSVYYGAVTITAVIAFVSIVFGSPYVVQGARRIAYHLQEQPVSGGSFTYVFHKHHSTDGMNAQLDWYLKGWMTGLKPGLSHQSIPQPEHQIDQRSLQLVMGVDRIVYYHPGRDRRNLAQMRVLLEPMYNEQVSTKDYTLFVLKPL